MQKYGIVVPTAAFAGIVNVRSPEENWPVSNETPFAAPARNVPGVLSLVTECGMLSRFRTVTVEPGVTSSRSGLKARP